MGRTAHALAVGGTLCIGTETNILGLRQCGDTGTKCGLRITGGSLGSRQLMQTCAYSVHASSLVCTWDGIC